MKFTPTPLAGSYIIDTEPFSDDRGWFERFYCKKEFDQVGLKQEWVQLNHSVTNAKGTIRGMHYQNSPHTEIKMVKCIVGTVWDVIIDLRNASPTFLQWFGLELSSDNKRLIYIPAGFAHGFQSLSDKCELIYHHSAYFNAGSESGIRYNDPSVNIKWPLPVSVISSRDAAHPHLDHNFKGL